MKIVDELSWKLGVPSQQCFFPPKLNEELNIRVCLFGYFFHRKWLIST